LENASGKSEKGFDVGALVVAVIAITTMLVVYLVPPQLTIFNHRLVVTQGIIVPGLLVGALLWGIIEIYTSRGKGKIDVILRPLLGFFIGAFIGGYLGYEFNFGQYIIVPAFHLNLYALYEFVAIFIAYVMFIIEAAWWHNKVASSRKMKAQ
jgi:hypothetical protein